MRDWCMTSFRNRLLPGISLAKLLGFILCAFVIPLTDCNSNNGTGDNESNFDEDLGKIAKSFRKLMVFTSSTMDIEGELNSNKRFDEIRGYCKLFSKGSEYCNSYDTITEYTFWDTIYTYKADSTTLVNPIDIKDEEIFYDNEISYYLNSEYVSFRNLLNRNQRFIISTTASTYKRFYHYGFGYIDYLDSEFDVDIIQERLEWSENSENRHVWEFEFLNGEYNTLIDIVLVYADIYEDVENETNTEIFSGEIKNQQGTVAGSLKFLANQKIEIYNNNGLLIPPDY